ncbi:uncharacterized protein LOC127831315 [Dreissena polymorpha]|uniref:uncharacterized protein LOC127831315 n=1 Tax=Dreissena polymorpha TaxID=45954 RepID=UPI0022650726|nr:uncharacterized protein LOC127831315 [Dreissena polymorpha]
MNTNDLQHAFKILKDLLSDSTCLAQDAKAQDGVRQLQKLETESWKITEAEMSRLLKNAQETLNEVHKVASVSITEMKTFLEQFYKRQSEEEEAICSREQFYKRHSEQEEVIYSREQFYKRHSEEEEVIYSRDVEDFTRHLISHYNNTFGHIPISPLLPNRDVPFDALFTTPSIFRTVRNQDGTTSETKVTQYADLLACNFINRQVFLQGEAGMGKTTVAAKLVLDWCNAQNGPPSFHGENSAFADIATLKQFKCVFFIKLGDHSGTSDVTEIIQKQIIDSIYTSTGRNDAYKLLNAILERDKCLLIQDGLDEWTSDDSRLVQPFMVASHSRCAVLTTSRSWKLTDERIKESQIDSLLVLKGVNDSNRMSKKMLHLLMPKDDIDSKHNEFLRDLDTFANNIDQMLVSPLLLSLIVCSWVEGNRLTNSRCKIYSILIDGLFKKVSLKRVYFVNQTFTCLKNTHYIQQHIKYLKVLSKIAFLMFGVKEEITDRELLKHLTSKQKLFALNVGILTERKCVTPTYTPSMFKFIHKSVREFLCAYYIACNPSAISSISNKIADGIDAVNILADVFIFLCGLKISSANRISQLLDNIINSHNMINITQSQFDNIQSKITQGFAEAKSNIQNEENIQFTFN